MRLFNAIIRQILSATDETGPFLSALGGRCLKGIGVILPLLLPLISLSQTIDVKQDGTGDYAQIQDAVDHAWPGDTVLVWPGTYYENLAINGKGLILGSLLMTTGDQAYKYSTIIDGGQNGSCISIEYVDASFEVNGFTLTNGGNCDYGGGIKI
ncbi:MAG: hypothetical protein GXO88_08285, partial [Chlorobi bacterium]|nr:hypothetical protein [Chlorobiota bacterium]